MNRRSRKGCIDCKRSKIKCDELLPSCGTCLRRGYACQGYPDAPNIGSPVLLKSNAVENRGGSRLGRRRYEHRKRSARAESSQDQKDSSASDSDAELGNTRQTKRTIQDLTAVLPPSTNGRMSSSMQIERVSRTPLCPRVPSIPRGTISRADEPVIEVYFLRHPSELVISSEFVDEMNSNVLQVFYEDPEGVSDSLSAIGYIYLDDGSQTIVPVLDRKARILARLRDRTELEQMLVMLLGLCALELIDGRSVPSDSALPAIIANAAIVIKHFEDTGKAISSVAQYFIRALARQDMMISLTQSRRHLIPCSTWLEDDSQCHADRFMGFTSPLMPLLAELSALAEDLRSQVCPTIAQSANIEVQGEIDDPMTIFFGENNSLFERAVDLRARLEQWRPLSAQHLSFQASRNLLFHAHAHKAAALLHLHRLMSPPGSSDLADHEALSMAHEVLLHLSAMSDQLKTALWPVLVAGSELVDPEDRNTGLLMFDEIYRQRRTVTALRTRNFCVERVWRARDDGANWNWMDLVYQYPGECMPI